MDALTGRSVVFTVGSEDVEDLGVLECRGLMLYAAGHKEGISRLRLESAAGVLEDEMAADDVDHLLMRMTMASAFPALAHAMPHQHHARAVGHHLTTQPLFGSCHCAVVGGDYLDIAVHKISLKF